VRERARPQLRAALAAATASLERTGLRAWTIGRLPRTVALRGTDGAVRAYPALVDEGETVGVRALESPEAQRAAMWAGTRRLLRLTTPSPRRRLRDVALPHEDVITAAFDALIAEVGGPAWDEAGFARLRDHVAGDLADRTMAIAGQVARILEAAREVERRLEALPGAAFEPARLDVARQLGRLVHPGFVAATGADRLPDVERYLRAAARRLERLPDNLAVDRDRMNAIHELEGEYERSGRRLPEVRWLLEELRVSHFAQALGTRGQVSSKRIRTMLRA
jgi:ATP-dependent helicase HrpA